MRALVIEDDGKDARRVATVLADAGFVILDADSGAEGIDLASHYEIGAIALDLTLPDIDGLAVIRKLRAAKIATPILVLTADAGQARKVEALNAGADDCVTKPTQVTASVSAGILRALSAECTSSFDVATAIARSRVYTTSTLCALARRGLVESRVPSSRREGAIWSITDAGRQWLGLGHAGRIPPDGRAGAAAA